MLLKCHFLIEAAPNHPAENHKSSPCPLLAFPLLFLVFFFHCSVYHLLANSIIYLRKILILFIFFPTPQGQGFLPVLFPAVSSASITLPDAHQVLREVCKIHTSFFPLICPSIEYRLQVGKCHYVTKTTVTVWLCEDIHDQMYSVLNQFLSGRCYFEQGASGNTFREKPI